jgi:hypothetical protein
MVSRRQFILSTGLLGAGGAGGWYVATGELPPVSGLADTIQETVSPPSVEEVKQNSETVPYQELYRNISEYEGEYVHYDGLGLIDIVEGEGTKEYILDFPGGSFGDGRVLYGIWDGSPFQEGDDIEAWGIINGLRTYTSLSGEETVPEVELVDIELL